MHGGIHEPGPGPALREFVARALGVGLDGGRWARLDRGRGSTRVWALELDGRGFVVKGHRGHRGFAQELEALRSWFGEERELGGAGVPELIAVDEQARTLLMRRAPGRPVSDLDDDEAGPAHAAAGRFLAALHGLACVDEDPLALDEALQRRFRAWSRVCAGALELEEELLVAALEPGVVDFSGLARVPCHRDFSPSNWLWDGSRLVVVDFEHARLDCGLVDLAKLCVAEWVRAPALRRAFFRGYGASLDELGVRRLRSVVALHALASLGWGLRHYDPAFVAEGRRALQAARGPIPP